MHIRVVEGCFSRLKQRDSSLGSVPRDVQGGERNRLASARAAPVVGSHTLQFRASAAGIQQGIQILCVGTLEISDLELLERCFDAFCQNPGLLDRVVSRRRGSHDTPREKCIIVDVAEPTIQWQKESRPDRNQTIGNRFADQFWVDGVITCRALPCKQSPHRREQAHSSRGHVCKHVHGAQHVGATLRRPPPEC